MSQYDLAKAADVHPNQVYLIESGKRKALRSDTLRRYAEALRVEEMYLLTGISGRLLEDGSVVPGLSDYLSRVMGLDPEQVEHVRRVIQAFAAEQERDLALEEAEALRAAARSDAAGVYAALEQEIAQADRELLQSIGAIEDTPEPATLPEDGEEPAGPQLPDLPEITEDDIKQRGMAASRNEEEAEAARREADPSAE